MSDAHPVTESDGDPLAAYRNLLGTWRGEGVGGYPSLDADFSYSQELTFAELGKPVLVAVSRTWSLDDGRPLAFETSYWRPQPDGSVEVVMAHASGVVEVYLGGLVDGPGGPHVEISTDVVARSPSAAEVAAEHRMYAVRGGVLMYAVDMAAVGLPLSPHLSAALHPADD